jgi:hypothetical protein
MEDKDNPAHMIHSAISDHVEAHRNSGKSAGEAFGQNGFLQLHPSVGKAIHDVIRKLPPGQAVTSGSNDFGYDPAPRSTSEYSPSTREGSNPTDYMKIQRKNHTPFSQLEPGEITTVASGHCTFGTGNRAGLKGSSEASGDPVRLVMARGGDGTPRYAIHLPSQVTKHSPERAPAPVGFETPVRRSFFSQSIYPHDAGIKKPLQKDLSMLMDPGNIQDAIEGLGTARDIKHKVANTAKWITQHPKINPNANFMANTQRPANKQISMLPGASKIRDAAGATWRATRPGSVSGPAQAVASNIAGAVKTKVVKPVVGAVAGAVSGGIQKIKNVTGIGKSAASPFPYATYPHEAGIQKAAIRAVGKVRPVARIIGPGSEHPNRPPVKDQTPAPKRDGNAPPPTASANTHPGGGEAPKMGGRLATQASRPPSAPPAPVLKPVAPGLTVGKIGTNVNTKA